MSQDTGYGSSVLEQRPKLHLALCKRESASHSVVSDFVTPWIVACQVPLGKSTGVGNPLLSSGDLLDSGIEPRSPALRRFFTI